MAARRAVCRALCLLGLLAGVWAPAVGVEVLHKPEVCRARPEQGDTLVVDYVGTLESGQVFDSSKKLQTGFRRALPLC
jgi:FKBP-type peptidyl-prolyl cis-trans isomerase